MITKVEKHWRELKDGDIFYFYVDNNLNDHLIGSNADLAGTDQIFIRDDVGTYEDNVFFEEDDTVIVIGHYSELL